MIGDILTTPNPYLILLASLNAKWLQAIAALEEATRQLKPDMAMVAYDAAFEASTEVNRLTNGHPDPALEARFIAAIDGWNKAGFAVIRDEQNTATPTWVWVLVGVLGIAVLRQQRGR